MAGKAPGSTIFLTTSHQDRPKLCPMRISERSTLSTAPKVATTVGVKTPKAIKAYFEVSSIPNQITNSGKSAIFGIGNSAETTGSSPARARVNSPMSVPMVMPATEPISAPTKSRCRDGSRCCHIWPVAIMSASVFATSDGRGIVSPEMAPVRVPISSTAISTIKTMGATRRIGWGLKPPPRKGTARTAILSIG